MAPSINEVHNESLCERINRYLWGTSTMVPAAPWRRVSTMTPGSRSPVSEGGLSFLEASKFTQPTGSPVKPIKLTLVECLLRVIGASGALADAALTRNTPVSEVSAMDAGPMDQPRRHLGMQPWGRRVRRDATLPDTENTPLQQYANSIPAIPDAQPNSHLIALLRKHGHAIADDDHRVASGTMIHAMVEWLEKNSHAKQIVAKHILRDLGYYGAGKDEEISEAYQSQVVRDLIIREFFDGNIEDFIVTQLAALKDRSNLTTNDISDVLRKRIYECIVFIDNDEHDDVRDFKIKQWIWQQVVLEALPVLRFEGDEQNRPFALDQPEWGQMHAALALLKASGVDAATISQQGALALGEMLQIQLNEKIVLPQWQAFFMLPAQCHARLYATGQETDIGKNRQDAVPAYFAFVDAYLDAQCPLSRFQKSLADFKTRPQLAQRIIDENCPGMEVESLLRLGVNVCWDSANLHWEDVNVVYKEQVAAIAQDFKLADQLLVPSAWATLAEEEIDFIDAAEVQRMQAEFTAEETIQSIPMGMAYELAARALRVGLVRDVELFAARRAGEERIYALRRTDAGYDVTRVDRNAAQYYDLAADSRPQSDADYVLKVNILGAKFAQKESMLAELFRVCVARHTEQFSEQMHAYGYEKSTTESVLDFLLSLIPFYTCITESRQGDADRAAMACSIDAISLIPAIGLAGKLPIKLAQALSHGTFVTMQKATRQLAARQAMSTVLRDGAFNFVQYGIKPTSKIVGRKELALVGRALFDAFDPGIQAIGSLGGGAMQQVVRFARLLEMRLPALREVLPKLDAKLAQGMSTLHSGSDAVGYLPGIGNPVALKKIPNHDAKGKAVYVQMHPETGELFGRKYTLADDGQLQVVPIGLKMRLNNLREQGLGGHGAEDARKAWAAADRVESGSRPISAQWLRMAQGRPLPPGGRTELALRHGIAESDVVRHLDEQGQLTGEGRAMLARADAAEMEAAGVQVQVARVPAVPVSDMHVRAWYYFTAAQRQEIGMEFFCNLYQIDVNVFRKYLQEFQGIDLSVRGASGGQQQAMAAAAIPEAPLPLAPGAGTRQLASGSSRIAAAGSATRGMDNPVTGELLNRWQFLMLESRGTASQVGFIREHRLNLAQWVQHVDRLGNVKLRKNDPGVVVWGPKNVRARVTKELLKKWQDFDPADPRRPSEIHFIQEHNIGPAEWARYVDKDGNIIRAAPSEDELAVGNALAHAARNEPAPSAQKRRYDRDPRSGPT